jgi:hypothetical protein
MKLLTLSLRRHRRPRQFAAPIMAVIVVVSTGLYALLVSAWWPLREHSSEQEQEKAAQVRYN